MGKYDRLLKEQSIDFKVFVNGGKEDRLLDEQSNVCNELGNCGQMVIGFPLQYK
jgi:hypothetical protein